MLEVLPRVVLLVGWLYQGRLCAGRGVCGPRWWLGLGAGCQAVAVPGDGGKTRYAVPSA